MGTGHSVPPTWSDQPPLCQGPGGRHCLPSVGPSPRPLLTRAPFQEKTLGNTALRRQSGGQRRREDASDDEEDSDELEDSDEAEPEEPDEDEDLKAQYEEGSSDLAPTKSENAGDKDDDGVGEEADEESADNSDA